MKEPKELKQMLDDVLKEMEAIKTDYDQFVQTMIIDINKINSTLATKLYKMEQLIKKGKTK